MRLTHLKLAGFKSFVDPTTVHVHGQRVGVVGPNGCGKSNVMESVRWVLGESSAKEMRGDNMDAVIFNGSSNRKPISRASVELVFDNSLGGASGEWSQYAEIAVKRVIERDKGSTYYINNTAVRRRDVADLFLGTGLGGKAYAIIGQNTISRIVEAKPEELRVFLEEAAGISKYKDRRRETELRLRDTSENLSRVEDICRELQKQINKLESQAIVAQKFHGLQSALKLADGQLWLLKKRDASRDWDKTKSQVEQLVNQLEAQTAELRKTEAQVEATRQAFYAATEHVNVSQAAYYEANADVSNLENQLRQNTEARERMSNQLQQTQHALERNATNQQALQAELTQANTELTNAAQMAEEISAELAVIQLALPEKAAALKAATEAAQLCQAELNKAEQGAQIAANQVQNLQQNLADLYTRLARLERDLTVLEMPNLNDLENNQTMLRAAELQAQQVEQTLQDRRADEANFQQQINELSEESNVAQRALNQAEAEINALEKLQQNLNSQGQLADWLNRTGLNKSARLWQKIKVDAQWQVALEAVLGAKLNALITHEYAGGRPPSSMVLAIGGAKMLPPQNNDALGLKSLISVIIECADALMPILQDWLAGVYITDTSPLNHTAKLALGEQIVTAEGDIFSRHSVMYHGENTSLQGVLERQQRLETVQQNLTGLQNTVADKLNGFKMAENALQASRQAQAAAVAEVKQATLAAHQLQLKVAQLQQAQTAASAREKTLQAEIVEIKQKISQTQTDIAQKSTLQQTAHNSLGDLQANLTAAMQSRVLAETAFNMLRDTVMQGEKSSQESQFNKRYILNNINNIENKVKVNIDEKQALVHRQAEAENTLKLTPMDTLKNNLNAAITQKTEREAALAQSRNLVAEQEQQLQAQERLRLQHEQQLHPMRDALEQSRLSEQEARLFFEQCQASLHENGLDEAVISKDLNENTKTNELLNKNNQLRREINNLGAVNLAAIEELKVEAERKTYLDSQLADLTLASETLLDAIKKIDRETRDKLMQTYNTANQHFADLFKTLFGGGQARLELLGDEILDTGVQVFAQPPGKKNTTIQLLSGGEKALTAIALVFALFRLNPAPFCLMDEVDAPLDDSNTERFCNLVKKMSEHTQFMFVSHNKITMEMAQQLIGVTMQESGVSRIVDVDIEAATRLQMQMIDNSTNLTEIES